MVFDGQDEEPDEEPGDIVRTSDEAFAERWGWFGVMYRLTGGDITKLGNIVDMELYVCLTWLTYETDLDVTTKNKRNDYNK